MSTRVMTDERLMVLIEAYGAYPIAWPEEERDAAEAHLAAHPERFEGALKAARRLDALFEEDAIMAPPEGLSARILADAPSARRRSGFATSLGRLFLPQGRRWPASAALASLVVGLFAGYTASAMTPASPYEDEAESIVYAALGYDGLETLIEEEVSHE